ncbi:MAG: type II toxin-antitoxin system MqsR family toxin [Bdellovibrio sp.]|nr:type II toxin-antitoxin system MqsR family toxin [Bdellovibrio sp.]
MRPPRWTQKIIDKIRQLAQQGNVQFTLKALRELAVLELGLDETDVCEILAGLRASDFRERIVSAVTREYLYVFTPNVFGVEIYLKVVVRENCVVISFHEDLKDEN